MLFEYYNQIYKAVLDETEYEKCRLKVYHFLLDAAQDGAVPPLPLVSTRLGEERTRAQSDLLAREGLLFDWYRTRKLLDYYLEPVAQKNGLAFPDVRLLLHLRQFGAGTRKDLADFAGLSRGSLSVQLQRLTAKGLVSVAEARALDDGEKQLKISFPPAAKPVLAELERVLEDFEAARLAGFTEGTPGCPSASRTISGIYFDKETGKDTAIRCLCRFFTVRSVYVPLAMSINSRKAVKISKKPEKKR